MRAGETLTKDELAQFSPEAREDHATILATFRYALTLPGANRDDFLRDQDAAQEEAKRPPSSLPSTRGRLSPTRWTTDKLVAAVKRASAEARSNKVPPLRALQHRLTDVGRLSVPNQPAFREAAKQLYGLTTTAEEAVEIASWLIHVTQAELDTPNLLYETINGAWYAVGHLRPRPTPDAYLDLISTHQSAISKKFSPRKHPLVVLVEIYTTLYKRDIQRMDPNAQSPGSQTLAKIDRLRLRHLDDVRAIHRAIRELGTAYVSQRSTDAFMDAYAHGRSFADVQALWEAATGVQGVGVDVQGVSIVSLARALFPGSLLPSKWTS